MKVEVAVQGSLSLIIIIIMDISKGPTLKALNKHSVTRIVYIEMETVISNLTHTHTHARTHARTHACTHAHARTHAHAHTHTHTPVSYTHLTLPTMYCV